MIKNKERSLVLIISFILTLLFISCQSEAQKDKQSEQVNAELSNEKQLEQLMDSLTNISLKSQEEALLKKIWEYSRPDLMDDFFHLSLSVVDSVGQRVTNNLSKARGRLKATITLSNQKKTWRKSVTYAPIEKDNLYYLMLE